MIRNIIFIHGYKAGPMTNWYPSITKPLESRELNVLVPQLPGDMYPEHEEWLQIMKDQFEGLDPEETLLVGHSLGTRAILLFLETFQSSVAGVLLVGAFSNDIRNAEFRGGNYANFFEHQVDIEKVKSLAKDWKVLHSADDDRIPVEQGKEIASDLDADFIEVDGFLHFKAPQHGKKVLEVLEKFL